MTPALLLLVTAVVVVRITSGLSSGGRVCFMSVLGLQCVLTTTITEFYVL